ncbi:hypothetical protein ARUE_c18890 [Arthrobacter sp. Rue61a]|nr:hypothetical protein ARUE_c18890 [Arthrobacter sp. Rue61a]
MDDNAVESVGEDDLAAQTASLGRLLRGHIEKRFLIRAHRLQPLRPVRVDEDVTRRTGQISSALADDAGHEVLDGHLH